MRVIALRTLRDFRESHPDPQGTLEAWYSDARGDAWKTPSDIRGTYRNASILGKNRVVFNIKGNSYRLVVVGQYEHGIVFVRFVGAHRDYDRINAETVWEGVAVETKDETGMIKPIKTHADYRAALAEIEQLYNAAPDTPAGDRLEVLVALVQAYETKHYQIPLPDPIVAIEYYLESRGWTRRALEPYIGSRARVSELLRRRRPLTVGMIRRLHAGLGIPAEVLIQPYELFTAA